MALNLARNETQRQFKITELGELLNQQYLKQGRPDGFTQKESFAPSGIGYGKGTCPRFWYYALNGAEYEENVLPQHIASMAYGTEAGVRIAKLFDEAGILIEAEAEARLLDPPIFGYIDAIVDWNGEHVVAEVKTTRQESFTLRATTMQPTIYNLIQILLYMHIKNMRRGFLLYENKNTQEFVTIPVEMTEENAALVEKVLAWLRVVHANATEEKKLPTRPFPSIKNKVCKQCPVKKVCWDDTDGVVTLPILELGGN